MFPFGNTDLKKVLVMNKYYFTDLNKNIVDFKHVTSLTLHIYQLYRDYIVVTFSKQFLLVTLTILDRKQIKIREI